MKAHRSKLRLVASAEPAAVERSASEPRLLPGVAFASLAVEGAHRFNAGHSDPGRFEPGGFAPLGVTPIPGQPLPGPLHSPHTGPTPMGAVRLLSLDAHGRVLDWINWQDASCLYVRGAVAWTMGDPCLRVHGGTCRITGEQSILDLHPIVASKGHARARALDPTPTLTNTALFARDAQLCLYCGDEFSRPHLTRDHVKPLSKGGRDIWENVVTACFSCNSRKSNRNPQQANMPLLAVPYRPSWIEHLILSNRNILADQMAFLRAQLPKKSKLAG